MKCPICGQELRPGKKDPNYLLCYSCKKKFKLPQDRKKKTPEKEQQYSNIPPKHVREKRETEMRKAYDEMLSVGDGKKKKKKPARTSEPLDDFHEDDYEDDRMSKAPVIILGIAIVIVAGLIVYMLLR